MNPKRRSRGKTKPVPSEAPDPIKARLRYLVWLLAALLVLGTIALYWPATRCGFISFDDDLYVTANAHVQNGLTWENLKWAFFNPVASNWHPLTMLSHMLDCQFYGLNPWGHHLTNVLLHALNGALVFVLLQQLTEAMWRSLLVAALFAVHPLRVESVVWVAERKDVLSGFFGLLTLIFYARYARKRATIESGKPEAQGNPAPDAHSAAKDYVLALFFLALGLMSKAMLVTWPFVMLLLDYWPLARFRPGRIRLLLVEKIPFFGLAVAVSIVTFLVQKSAGAEAAGEYLSFDMRASNAVISYCRYLGKLFWPTDLAVFYPHPGYWPIDQVGLAGLFLAAVSVLFFVKRRPYPFLLMGWLWYLGMLVPVIGLVQVGEQAMADRYAYIPSVGVLILTVWGAHELTRRWRNQVIALSLAGAAAIVLCGGLTRQQIGFWQDSETLFRHALAVTKNNYLAHYNLAVVLEKKGQFDEAVTQYQASVRLAPGYAGFHNNLGIALYKKGDLDDAISQYENAIRLKPNYPDALYNLATARYKEGQLDGAISLFQEVIRLKPDHADAHNNLGTALYQKGHINAAIGEYQAAIRLRPDDAAFHNNLGIARERNGQTDQAISEYQEALRLKPDDVPAENNLTRALEIKNGPAGH
jgi:tetratricopeptide (TPR) repeat protein